MNDSPASTPSVTVVIPHLKNRPMLDTCLDSLRRSRWPGLAVLVVDNGGDSSDLTGIESNYPEIELIRLPSNAGYAGGCNEGLRRCTSKYVVFLNDDTEVEPGWLGLLVDEAERDRTIGALQPKILSLQAKREGKRLFDYAGAAGGLLDRLGFPFCLGRTFAGMEEDRGQYDAPAELFWASGVALFAPRELLASLGGFDAGFFMHMEEIDLCWRMRLRGYHIRSVPGSVVWHEGGASLRQGSPLKVYYNHRNSLAMLLQNRSAPALSLVVPVRILLELAAFVYYLAGGSEGWQRAIQVYRAAADNLRAIGATLLKRREAQGGRRIPERALFRGAPLSVFLLRRATQPSTRDSQ